MLFFCYYFELAKKTTLNSNIFINRLYLLSGLCIIINYNIKQCDGTTYGHMLSLVPKFIISELSGGRTSVGLKKKNKIFSFERKVI